MFFLCVHKETQLDPGAPATVGNRLLDLGASNGFIGTIEMSPLNSQEADLIASFHQTVGFTLFVHLLQEALFVCFQCLNYFTGSAYRGH